ncbi:MAG: hypothetical protein HZA92_16410 [Verrucomicrobia bacterium]|nr:hypothetical protein [Verrucomicrobiota bacterium]
MKTLYWKTRPLRRTPTGGRRIHWPGLALNLALALALAAVPVFGFVLIDLKFNVAEALPLFALALPIVLTLGIALTALGFGFRLTTPLDCLPGENGEPPARRTTRWFHWANLRAVLFGVLASITVLLLARTLSDWQGRRAWEAYRAEAEKRGVVFDLEKLMPPPVPDAENFAATPLLLRFQSGTKEWREARASTNYSERLATPIRTEGSGIPPKRIPAHAEQWLAGERTDLLAWQTYYQTSTNWPKWPQPRSPAEDVLKALSRYDTELAELRTAATRPHTWFNIHVTEDGASTLLPHLSVLKSATEVVRLRAVAELAAGRTNEAFADVQLMFRLADTLKDEPIFITHLVRIAMHTMALRAIWEGLADHRWSDAQLAHWQADLAKLNFGVEVRHAMAGERAIYYRAIDFLRRKPEMFSSIVEAADGGWRPPDGPGIRAIPAGWFYREQISYNRLFDDFIVSALPSEAGKFDPARIRSKSAAMTDELQREHRPSKAILSHRWISNRLLPALGKAMHRACQAQGFAQLAITACALERHWLARGSYPESLGALAPEFAKQLPLDPMSGQPFHYERTADGRFRLWSVGWNGKDDGGAVGLREPAKKELDFEKGDWVWPVPVQ